MKQKNEYSHLTAKDRDKLSFPMNWLKRNNLIKNKVLVFGCGFGSDVDLLNDQGFSFTKYDKFYFNEYPKEKYDTITCIYVLNVVDAWEQSNIIMSISNLLKPNGKAYFIVRRDIANEGFRTHFVHKKQTYQTNVKLPFKSIYQNEFTEIYEYQHFANTNNFLFETALAYSYVEDKRAIIKPKREVKLFLDLSLNEQISCIIIANKINKNYNLDIQILDDFELTM